MSLLRKYIDCTGCERENVVYLNNFPDDYPRDKMLCCACVVSYFQHVGVPKPCTIHNTLGVIFHILWWETYGKGIEKAMRLQ